MSRTLARADADEHLDESPSPRWVKERHARLAGGPAAARAASCRCPENNDEQHAARMRPAEALELLRSALGTRRSPGDAAVASVDGRATVRVERQPCRVAAVQELRPWTADRGCSPPRPAATFSRAGAAAGEGRNRNTSSRGVGSSAPSSEPAPASSAAARRTIATPSGRAARRRGWRPPAPEGKRAAGPTSGTLRLLTAWPPQGAPR